MTTLESTPAGRLTDLLRESFGFERFRPYQEDVCRAVTAGEDVLLVMPTGAGKSLCYQLPGLARGGTTLVISPLIALMEDQVAALRARGLRAERVHSGRPRPESRQVCLDYVEGTLDFLFIAPERLGVAGFPEMLARRLPALVAVDEAHCISQWGHDFRPDYRMLGERLPLLRPAPVIGMTATATPLVQKDICDQLGIPRARRFIHGFRRDNIGIELIDMVPSARVDAAARLLADPARRPAIVYAPSRRQTEDLVERFSGLCRVAGYHAGMPAEQRAAAQAAFQSGEVEIIVATIAFGMGIDKADIRTVVHMAMPASVESYYQEIGRAGRDGAASRAVMLSGWSDRKTHEFFMDREYPAPEVLQRVWDALGDEPRSRDELRDFLPRDAERIDAALRKLCIHGGARLDASDEATRGRPGWLRPYQAQSRHKRDQLDLITQYAGSRNCRMVHLVGHFGDQEDEGHACGQCDVCAPDACVARSFRHPDPVELPGLKRLLEDLRRQDGQSSGRLHQELFGQSLDRDGFERLAGALVRAGLVQERTDSFEKDGRVIVFRRLYLTAKAQGAVDLVRVPMEADAPTRAVRPARRAARSPQPRGSAGLVDVSEMRTADAGLVEALRVWRLEESRRREVPAFCVLSNKTLQGIASARPRDERSLLGVKGVGPKVVAEFGDAILGLVRARGSELDE